MIFNIPNIITFLRIAVIPLICLVLAVQLESTDRVFNFQMNFIGMILFALAGFSDLADGYFARKYQQVSLLGKFFDPMADKLIHMGVMVFLVALMRMPAWFVVVLLFREIFITGLRSAAAGENIIIDASQIGKLKTAWLNVGLGGLIFYEPILGLNVQLISWVCLSIGLVLAMISGFEYTYLFFKNMSRKG